MRKALIPMLASLALCGAATTALVISSARAEPSQPKPMMVAMTTPQGLQLAANDTPPAPPPRGRRGLAPGDLADRMKQGCQDMVARENGRLAYLETSLNLTASEQSLFQRWKDARLGIARRHADQCVTRVSQRLTARQGQSNQSQAGQNQSAPPRPAMNRPGPAERMAQEEDRLKQRLADIQAERPALEAFTNALSPQQKMELARRERGPGTMMRGRKFADAMGPRGPMGPGMPMGPGVMGRPPLGAPPPQER